MHRYSNAFVYLQWTDTFKMMRKSVTQNGKTQWIRMNSFTHSTIFHSKNDECFKRFEFIDGNSINSRLKAFIILLTNNNNSLLRFSPFQICSKQRTIATRCGFRRRRKKRKMNGMPKSLRQPGERESEGNDDNGI